jgi:hypothetical protein
MQIGRSGTDRGYCLGQKIWALFHPMKTGLQRILAGFFLNVRNVFRWALDTRTAYKQNKGAKNQRKPVSAPCQMVYLKVYKQLSVVRPLLTRLDMLPLFTQRIIWQVLYNLSQMEKESGCRQLFDLQRTPF